MDWPPTDHTTVLASAPMAIQPALFCAAGSATAEAAVPAEVAELTGQNTAGWLAIGADAKTVVWSVGGQSIAKTYFADVSAGPDSAVVGSDVDRPVAASEIRQVVKNGDRTAWTPSVFLSATNSLVTSGSAKLFSDKYNPNVFYAFTGTTMYVSEDAGRTFRAVSLSGVGIPNASWTSNNQSANKIQVDVYNTCLLY